jgi:16S rRNA (uracil1498-N3)-methyltransferase
MPVLEFREWIGTLVANDDVRLLLAPAATVALGELPAPMGKIVLLAGPEGGLAPAETQIAISRGFQGVRLGPRVLRTETAALAALAAMQARWGDF